MGSHGDAGYEEVTFVQKAGGSEGKTDSGISEGEDAEVQTSLCV